MEKNNIVGILEISERLYKKLKENIKLFSKDEMIELSVYQYRKMEPIKNKIYDLEVACEKRMDELIGNDQINTKL